MTVAKKTFFATEITEDTENTPDLLKPFLCVLCGKLRLIKLAQYLI